MIKLELNVFTNLSLEDLSFELTHQLTTDELVEFVKLLVEDYPVDEFMDKMYRYFVELWGEVE